LREHSHPVDLALLCVGELPAARRRSVTSQKSFLFMAFSPFTAMGMPQKEAFENHISWLERE
jgi:hypothetical protein